MVAQMLLFPYVIIQEQGTIPLNLFTRLLRDLFVTHI